MHKTGDFSEKTEAEKLNQHCACVTLDRRAITRALADQLGDDAYEIQTNPNWRQLFSNVAVFVPPRDLEQMGAIVQALEEAAALPAYQRRVLSWAPQSAQFNPGPVGAFMGYDFHLSKEGPRLIEINTNAGGAFLNAMLAQAQLQCCNDFTRAAGANDFDAAVTAQFESEWRAQRGSGRPERIAIVDDQPSGQYLYPEFRLAQQSLRRNGIDALILSPADLRYDSGTLYGSGKRIELVYNRLVDFGLEDPEHTALRCAWLDGRVVITPNPHAHALFADKRNLAVLSDHETLSAWGLSPEKAELLHSGIPRTVKVTADNADALWQQRREWFFKPVAGYGSKGVYRGSKLTKNTFNRILESDYIAQAYIPPSERLVLVDGEREMLKVDVRLYTYRGDFLMAAARLYRGQATNFRTLGGGFAPVLLMVD
ncbi:hypothetical protein QLQ86_00145 [Halomonas sp. LR5S13]|uniref:hypothetical protein n=1 Tax=Halomonas rhizosphaerae TaxID=3043296 RepID=UPI0024A99E62|nr:hypothetical protein [Halomonas rhizosphaerae]MDI5919202.1 hypothetical protein [Halomonas rhizosphaerae]